MQKIIVCILVAGLLMTGCTFLRLAGVKTDGKDVGGAYALISGKAERVDMIYIGYTLLTTEKLTKEFLQNLPKVLVRVDKDNKMKSVGVETNFTPKNEVK